MRMAPRSPRLKPTPTRETKPAKSKKDKQKKLVLVRASPRNHFETQNSKNDKKKIVDLEVEQGQGT